MRQVVEAVVELGLFLTLTFGWLVQPSEVVSGSMSPTLLGPHRSFTCAECGARNDLPAEVHEIPGRVAYCTACRTPGPVIDSLPITAGDRVLIDRSAFLTRSPQRWEVIAFRLPHEARRTAVKRIVGLPGETIELHAGKFFVDGKPIAPPSSTLPHEPDYSPPPSYRGPLRWTLGPDEYFVAGDNSTLSDDSRLWPEGPGVQAQLIVGKPFAVHYAARAVAWRGRAFHVPDVAAIRYIR